MDSAVWIFVHMYLCVHMYVFLCIKKRERDYQLKGGGRIKGFKGKCLGGAVGK